MGHDIVEFAGYLAAVFGEGSAHFGFPGALELVGAFFLFSGIHPRGAH
jgi:hypothetical protein